MDTQVDEMLEYIENLKKENDKLKSDVKIAEKNYKDVFAKVTGLLMTLTFMGGAIRRMSTKE